MSSLGGLNLSEQLERIFLQIGEAQTLDGNGDELGAYRHYLSSVSLATQVLSADIQANQGQGTMPEMKVRQLFKMASHCLERGEDIFTTARKEQRPLALFRLATPSPISSPTLSTPPTASVPSHLASSTVPSALPTSSITSEPSSTRTRASTLDSSASRGSLKGKPHFPGALPKSSTLRRGSMQPSPSSSNPNRGRSGSGSIAAGSTQNKVGNWMVSKRSKLQGIPGLLGRKNGEESVDDPSQQQQQQQQQQYQDGYQRSKSAMPATGAGEDRSKSVAAQPHSRHHTVQGMSYRKEAELRNRHVMEQYKALLKKRSASSPGTPVSNEARLSMLRRLEENLSVARIREENISRRLKEKKLRDKGVGSKVKAIAFISMSVDELCDQVTSFEHGKPQITALKARLNASDSDPSTVYSSISEILSVVDHPLSRLLGEYQYTVVMMLQPVVLAVEKAGGLPRVGIRLDTSSSISGHTSSGQASNNASNKAFGIDHTQTGTRADGGAGKEGAKTEEDELMDMLNDEYVEMADSPFSSPPAEKDEFDEKLKRLRKELTELEGDTGKGEGAEIRMANPSDSCRGLVADKSDPGSRVNRDTGESEPESAVHPNARQLEPSSGIYMNTFRGSDPGSRQLPRAAESEGEDAELRNAPMFDSNDNSRLEESSDNFNLYTDLPEVAVDTNRNASYGMLPGLSGASLYDIPRPNPRPLDEAASSILEKDRNVYEDIDDVTKALAGNNISSSREGEEEGEETHIYEMLENVLGAGMRSVGNKSNGEPLIAEESTDGSMMSRPSEGTRKSNEIEMEEVPVFANLPPLVALAYKGDMATLGKLSDTAGDVLKEVIGLVQQSFKTLQQCFSSCYPILNSEDNLEVCHSVLEASFFPAIVSLLTTVYRCKNYKSEVALAENMSQQVNASPRDLAVRRKYWLIEQMYAPYGEAIDEVRKMPGFQYPSSKLECVVRMSKRVVKCIEEYFKRFHPDKKMDLVGVDDMLPIFSYVILRSGMPQLVSECSIMEEFIQAGYMMGEEGFCLTSFLTALRYLLNMSEQNS